MRGLVYIDQRPGHVEYDDLYCLRESKHKLVHIYIKIISKPIAYPDLYFHIVGALESQVYAPHKMREARESENFVIHHRQDGL